MKHTISCAIFALLTLPAIAADEIIIQAKIIESAKPIPHDMAKLAASKGVDLLAAPQVVTRVGQEARIEVGREFQPSTIASPGFDTVTTGVVIRITPNIKDGQLAFAAQLTRRELIESKAAATETHTEILSRDLYVSSIPKDGEAVWFHFAEPRNGKKLAVWLQLKRKEA